MKGHGELPNWLIGFAYHLLKLWVGTLRFQVDDPARLHAVTTTKRCISVVWHNRLLIFPFGLKKFVPGRQGAALISASRDGAILAQFVKRFGFDVVRGSSSRKGTGAILQLADVIESGGDVVITPDGPRGPAYRLGGGVILLAQKTKTPIVPVNMEYSSCWRLKSWDRFIIPKPFSRVRVIIGPLHYVNETESDEGFEAERVRLEQVMMSLVERR